MFTGIVEKKTKVLSHTSKRGSLFLKIEKPKGWKISSGESIATDGACLTVKTFAQQSYTVELMPETLAKTTFGNSVPNNVNLERSLQYGDRLSGHFVSGHIDTVGKIAEIKRSGTSKVFIISFPRKFRRLLVPKGSIAVDGVSLTVVDIGANVFSVALLDYTLKHTTLGDKKIGDAVNLEFDILAKYLLKK